MAKFCGKCGAKLDEATGLCPNCDAEKIRTQAEYPVQPKHAEKAAAPARQENAALSKTEEKKQRKAEKKEQKEQKKAAKRGKLANLTVGQKMGRFFLKLLLWMLLLVAVTGGIIAGLSYMGISNIPFLSEFNEDNILETLNKRAIAVEESDIVMETDTEGTATIIVKMPNYELLFKEAYASENPDRYLAKALILGHYEVQEYEETAAVTVANGVTTIHSDEVVHRLLEKALINAINALTEVE